MEIPLSQKGDTAPPILILTHVLWPNSWMDQDTTWYGGIDLSSDHIVLDGAQPHCVRWGAAAPPEKGTAALPLFPVHVYCGQTVAHLSYC